MKKHKKPSPDQIKSKLTPEQYNVTQNEATERPFQNEYWDNHEEGIYVDIVTGEPLFSSHDKFDSGTGWPSFTKPLNQAGIVEKSDHHLTSGVRTEVRSKQGDSHLGHVFEDGPAHCGGLRYCINSAALKFIPVAKLKESGYEELLPLFERENFQLTSKGLFRTRHSPKTLPETELATFAAGCFWGVEQEFRKQKGVVATAVGFMGGSLRNPSYEDVCHRNTGHAEVVQVEFDPKVISYENLLNLYWQIHDPTTYNRQGPDVGSQYRSALFFHSPEQKATAILTRDRLQESGELDHPIVTQIVPASEFYRAEEYHQQYVEKGGQATCHFRRR